MTKPTDLAPVPKDASGNVGDGVGLRSRTGGSVAFGVREFAGRRVVFAEVGGENRGALRPADGENLAIAARTAREKRIPLVCFMASSGAAIDEGV